MLFKARITSPWSSFEIRSNSPKEGKDTVIVLDRWNSPDFEISSPSLRRSTFWRIGSIFKRKSSISSLFFFRSERASLAKSTAFKEAIPCSSASIFLTSEALSFCNSSIFAIFIPPYLKKYKKPSLKSSIFNACKRGKMVLERLCLKFKKV